MVSLGAWGRLAASLVLCAMLSVVLAVAGPSADAQVTEHPADSCDGENACTGLAVGDVGAGSCNGYEACRDAFGDVGAGSCNAISACRDAVGPIGAGSCNAVAVACYSADSQIDDSSCNADLACYRAVGSIGVSSCNAVEACLDAVGPIGNGSCNGDKACYRAVGSIGDCEFNFSDEDCDESVGIEVAKTGCTEGVLEGSACVVTVSPGNGAFTCPAVSSSDGSCNRLEDRVVVGPATGCSTALTNSGQTWGFFGNTCLVTPPNLGDVNYVCDTAVDGQPVTATVVMGVVSTCTYTPPPTYASCSPGSIDTNNLYCRFRVELEPGAPSCADGFSLDAYSGPEMCRRYSYPGPEMCPVGSTEDDNGVCRLPAVTAAGPAPSLAFTGTTTTTLTFVALGLIGAGAMLAPAGRRRR